MDIARKITIAQTAIKSITRHDDEDSLVRGAALKRLKKFMDEEEAEIAKRAEERANKVDKQDDEGELQTLTSADVGSLESASGPLQ